VGRQGRGRWRGNTHTRLGGCERRVASTPQTRAGCCALRSVLAVYACAAARHAPHSSPTPARPGTNQRALRLGEAGERHWWFLTTPCKMTNFMFKAVQDA